MNNLETTNHKNDNERGLQIDVKMWDLFGSRPQGKDDRPSVS